MLTIAGLQKSYGGRTLFDDVAFTLMAGERIGLVGPNGAGKSTLLKIILGLDEPNSGDVTFIRGTRIGYLPQESEAIGNETVLDIAVPHDEEHDGQVIAKTKQILTNLSFKQSDFDRPARELSGGWAMRAHLARLLAQEPDLLMLDEPTNHLDLETLLWVQDYLRAYRGGILLISHDREFLNRLCTHIAELRSSRILRYTGNYDQYLVQREANELNLIATRKAQLREIDRLQTFADRFRAKNTKATQAQSKLKQIERIKEGMDDAPADPDATIGFTFPQPPRSGHRVITLDKVKFGYTETPIYNNLHFEAERGQRTVLIGPNGAGKSTLLKLLAGVLTPQAGEVKLGHNVVPGYHAQHRVAQLAQGRTVFEEALDTPQSVREQFVRTVLGSFLFRGDDIYKKVNVLSGGEKSRLALVKLLLNPPNLLLMDEPTTHLDLASVDALIEALQSYEGTLVFISHDVHFIRQIAKHVVRVEAGQLRHFPGGYEYYLDKTGQAARAGLTSSAMAGSAPVVPKQSAPTIDRKEQRRQEAMARQAKSDQKKKITLRIQALEKEIADLEAKEKQLAADLESPAPGEAMRINRELVKIQNRLPIATAEWESAGAQLSEFEKAPQSSV